MKIKTVLLFALFVGLVTIQNATANCPQTIIYPQYKKLIDKKEVEGYVYFQQFMTFDMNPGQIIYYNAVDSDAPRYCAYTYKEMIDQEPSMLTIKLKGLGSSKKNKK